MQQEKLNEHEQLALLRQRVQVRNRIAERTNAVLSQAVSPELPAAARVPDLSTNTVRCHVSASSSHPTVINMVESGDEESTMDYSDEASEHACAGSTTNVTPASAPVRVIPKTVEDLWTKVKAIQAKGCLDPPMCSCKTCPYSFGPLMLQRHILMSRLVELEKFLYGV